MVHVIAKLCLVDFLELGSNMGCMDGLQINWLTTGFEGLMLTRILVSVLHVGSGHDNIGIRA